MRDGIVCKLPCSNSPHKHSSSTRSQVTKMFAFAALAALASTALPKVLAHGGVLSYSNAGSWYQGWAVSHSAGESARQLVLT